MSFKSMAFSNPSRAAVWGLLLLAESFLESASSQVSTASIAGTIRDSSSGVVKGAEVVATQTQTGTSRTVRSGDDGSYAFPLLSIGSFTLQVHVAGFSPYEQTGIVLTVGQAASIDVVLRPGNLNQTITVSADAAIVNTTESASSSLIAQRQVEGLPLNGRNPSSLIFLAGGVSNPVQNIPTSNTGSAVLQNSLVYPTEVAPTVHGVRGGGVYFSLDGANNLDPYQVSGGPFPNPDASEEFSVVSGVYGSRYVSAPGGAVNIVTKSGTNQIHGDLFEFLRNGAVNARNFFSPQPDVLKRNQFGGTLGGPILKDRWFVFGSYQGTRLSNRLGGQVAFVPTNAERAGNFSALGVSIPISKLDPTMQKLLQYIPVSSSPDGRFVYAQPISQQEDQYIVRSDYYHGSHRIFGRYFYDAFNWAPTGIPNGDILASYRGQNHKWYNATVGDTWTKGNLVSDFRFSYVRDESVTTAGENSVSLPSLGAAVTPGQFPTIQQLTVSGFFNVVPGNFNSFPRHTFDFAEDVNIIRGRHQLSFGAEVQRISATLKTDNGQNPTLTYSGALSGNALADFFLGTPSTLQQSDGIYVAAQGTLPGFYVEDKFRATSRLNLTAGIRWDPYWPFHAQGGRIECFRPGEKSSVFTNAPGSLVFPGDANCNSAGATNNLANIEPRFGFAYELDSSAQTVLRGGYGIYTTQFPLASFLGFGQVQPFVRTFILTAPGSITNPYATFPGGNPFANGFQLNLDVRPPNTAFINPATAYSLQPDFKLGYVQQWSLILERSLTKNDIVSLSYFGTKGTRLSLVQDANQAIYIPGQSTQTNTQARRPYGNIGRLNSEVDYGTSSYNGVEASFRHRFQQGFSLDSTVTFSKSLDDASSPANILLTGGSLLSMPGNRNFRRALSDFDQNYTWRTSGVWDISSPHGATGLKRILLAGWQLNGILTVEAGLPFSVASPFNESFTGNGTELADNVSGTPITLSSSRSEAAKIGEYFNIAAFKNNQPGTFGTSGRNILRSPGLVNLDTAAIKGFYFTERYLLQFRTEFFNTLNHTQFLPPGNSLGTATFGQLTGSRDPRILQFSLKLHF